MEYDIEQVAHLVGAEGRILKGGRIAALLTDSRRLSFPETTLFFALKTATNDGHRYIDELYRMRVRNFVVEKMPDNASSMPDASFLVVKSPLEALARLAAFHRSRFDIPVVGITGSNGKTMVKEFLYHLLGGRMNVVRSPRSYNSKIGVPLSVWEMSQDNDMAIFEAGISAPGEMSYLEKVIKPVYGILTGIGEAHQENFSSLEEKCLEKLNLFSGSRRLVFDADDTVIADAVRKAGLSDRAFGWSRKDASAPLYVRSVEKDEVRSVISYVCAGGSSSVAIPFTDDASVENAVHCLAFMIMMGYDIDPEAFATLEPVAMRLEVKQGINNSLLINDTYNSDFNSIAIALDFQHSRKKAKRLKSTLVISDVLESGENPQKLYRRLADLVSLKGVEKLIGIGPQMCRFADCFDVPQKSFFMTTDEFISSPAIRDFENELILVKGARQFNFEKISERLSKKLHETTLEVNLDAVVHNFNFYRSRLRPQTKMVCMVKAFAYGAGSYEIAKTLQEHRCDYLAVAVADEGVELRKEGITIPIMVMNPEFGSFNALFEYRLEPEVYSFRLLDALADECRRRGVTDFPVHLKVDTGMHRLGFRPDQMEEVCEHVRRGGGIDVKSLFSHFAGSDSQLFDDFTHLQLERYASAASALEKGLGHKVIKHILNTAGIERFTEYQMDMVRLGIGLYGVSASGMEGLRNISTLKTTILQIQDVPAGDSIGYSRKTFVDRDSRIAIIPIGYADGFNRHFGNGKGSVLVNGHLCPVVGNVCMDACMVDVTDADAREGDSVVIFGDDLPVSRLSEELGTIPYEILTSVSPRVKRIYYRE